MMKRSNLYYTVALCLVAILFLMWLVAFYWSREPVNLNIEAITKKEAKQLDVPVVTGAYTTTALIYVTETLLNKPGGYLSNDVSLPGVIMDNMPSWEYGALTQVRDMARAMRDNFSRSQSQSREDKDLMQAESELNNDYTSWAMPDAQKKYQAANDHFRQYLRRLSQTSGNDAQFYARADNLSFWLSLVEVRLGGLSQKLSASVGQRRLNTDLSGDTAGKSSTPASDDSYIKTPWLQIDDVFYEARGSTWALIQLMKAIEIDFADVLANKNARVSFAQVIRELEASQGSLLSPWVLNGSGFGLWANYSLVMASYISRANASVIDLRSLLERG